jgi:GNAT superfamily N-acetyltransferase
MPAQIFTISERPDLENRLDEIIDPWPEFMNHDPVVRRFFPRLYERFRDFQFVLYEPDLDVVLGEACSIPIRWEGGTETLPEGVRVLETGFAESNPNVLCALMAVVDERHRGQRLSGLIVERMARTAADSGFDCLIAPVRPTWKERYPLTSIERYMRWTREDGLPFDPWIRLHHTLGAEILAAAPASMDIRGSVADWEEWTGMSFPEDGDYVVPGALAPVRFKDGVGRYVEPNVWMRHGPR